jgi:hypothetical protein
MGPYHRDGKTRINDSDEHLTVNRAGITLQRLQPLGNFRETRREGIAARQA